MEGFTMSYSSKSSYEKTFRLHNLGFMYSDKLDEVVRNLLDKWYHLDYIKNGTRYKDFFFNGEGSSAVVQRIILGGNNVDRVELVKFVSATLPRLRNALGEFDLPFQEDRVNRGLIFRINYEI